MSVVPTKYDTRDLADTPVMFTDQLLTDAGADQQALPGEYLFYGDNFTIWTGAGETGTQLTLNTDYTLNDVNTRRSDATGRLVYAEITITNATYQTGDLYLNGEIGGGIIGAADINRLQEQVLALSEGTGSAPIGLISPWGDKNNDPDPGWLRCDGSEVSRTGAYAELFARIGTEYGVGDGSTTFNLPKDEYRHGWTNLTDWTDITQTINHGMNKDLPGLDVDLVLGSNGTDAISQKADYLSYNAVQDLGVEFQNTDADNFVFQTGDDGILILNASGQINRLTTASYWYDVIVSRKDVPQGAIIKAENVLPTGEPVSATAYKYLRGSSTTWNNQTLTVTHGLNTATEDLIIKIESMKSSATAFDWQETSLGDTNAGSFTWGVAIVDTGSLNAFDIQTGIDGAIPGLSSDGNDRGLIDGQTGNMRALVLAPAFTSKVAPIETTNTYDISGGHKVAVLPDAATCEGTKYSAIVTGGDGTYTFQWSTSDDLIRDGNVETPAHEAVQGEGVTTVIAKGGDWVTVEYEDMGSNANGDFEKHLLSADAYVADTKDDGLATSQVFNQPITFVSLKFGTTSQHNSASGTITPVTSDIPASLSTYSVQVLTVSTGTASGAVREFTGHFHGKW